MMEREGDITVRYFTGPHRFAALKEKAEKLRLYIEREEDGEVLFITVTAQNIREATNIVYDALEERW
jgi:hypothetical protein